MIGDLVIEPEKSSLVEEVVNADDLLIEQADNEVEEIDMPEELDADPDGKKPPKASERRIEEVLIDVTAENIQKYTLNDVVMPIIGFKTRMPNN